MGAKKINIYKSLRHQGIQPWFHSCDPCRSSPACNKASRTPAELTINITNSQQYTPSPSFIISASSAILQVAQEVNEPWPVEVYSHAGVAYNITMNAGEMVSLLSCLVPLLLACLLARPSDFMPCALRHT